MSLLRAQVASSTYPTGKSETWALFLHSKQLMVGYQKNICIMNLIFVAIQAYQEMVWVQVWEVSLNQWSVCVCVCVWEGAERM